MPLVTPARSSVTGRVLARHPGALSNMSLPAKSVRPAGVAHSSTRSPCRPRRGMAAWISASSSETRWAHTHTVDGPPGASSWSNRSGVSVSSRAWTCGWWAAASAARMADRLLVVAAAWDAASMAMNVPTMPTLMSETMTAPMTDWEVRSPRVEVRRARTRPASVVSMCTTPPFGRCGVRPALPAAHQVRVGSGGVGATLLGRQRVALLGNLVHRGVGCRGKAVVAARQMLGRGVVVVGVEVLARLRLGDDHPLVIVDACGDGRRAVAVQAVGRLEEGDPSVAEVV